MADQSITFFPVGNGDTTLIRLSDGASILIDCHVREDESGVYPVHEHLLEALEKKGEVAHLGVFTLSHPHDDHCKGFGDIFYVGNPVDYSSDDKKAGRIVIDELWFAPRIFNEYSGDLSDDAKAVLAEAQRRVDLYRSGTTSRSDAGNRLRVIGYSSNAELDGLDDILTVPGGTLDLINSKAYDDFRFFVYAPVRKDTDSPDADLNDTSIVLQARFDVDGTEDAAKVFLGGDAHCAVWERIVDYNKDTRENLEWDLLLAPHHCSWSFFSSDSYSEKEPNPSEKVMDLLNAKREGACVIASCIAFDEAEGTPPHKGARALYEEVVGSDRFLCTGEQGEKDAPEPIYFEMTSNGPVRGGPSGAGRLFASASTRRAISTPRTYG